MTHKPTHPLGGRAKIKFHQASHISLSLFFVFTRTELLECYGDQDFLAKLHCVRQAFQVCLCSCDICTFYLNSVLGPFKTF